MSIRQHFSFKEGADTSFIYLENLSWGNKCTWQYEDAELPGRPVNVTEQVPGDVARITERFVWDDSAEEKALNLAGACVSYYDTAGLTQTDSVA